MKNKVMWMVIGWVLVAGVLWTVSAYSVKVWSPIEFFRQIVFTSDGTMDLSKATIKIDGRHWVVAMKELTISGQNLLSLIEWIDQKLDAIQTSTLNHNTSTFYVDGITTTADGYYIVDADKIQDGCNFLMIPNKSKCILKIGNIYVSPSSVATRTGRVSFNAAKKVCDDLDIAGIGTWHLGTSTDLNLFIKNVSDTYKGDSYRYIAHGYHSDEFRLGFRRVGYRADLLENRNGASLRALGKSGGQDPQWEGVMCFAGK